MWLHPYTKLQVFLILDDETPAGEFKFFQLSSYNQLQNLTFDREIMKQTWGQKSKKIIENQAAATFFPQILIKEVEFFQMRYCMTF